MFIHLKFGSSDIFRIDFGPSIIHAAIWLAPSPCTFPVVLWKRLWHTIKVIYSQCLVYRCNPTLRARRKAGPRTPLRFPCYKNLRVPSSLNFFILDSRLQQSKPFCLFWVAIISAKWYKYTRLSTLISYLAAIPQVFIGSHSVWPRNKKHQKVPCFCSDQTWCHEIHLSPINETWTCHSRTIFKFNQCFEIIPVSFTSVTFCLSNL